MKLSELPLSVNEKIICDSEFEDMNYCTAKMDVPFLTFLEKEKFLPKMNENAVCVICKMEIKDVLPEQVKGIIISENPKYVFHQLFNQFQGKKQVPDRKSIIPKSCQISPLAYVSDKNVELGENVIIEAYAAIFGDVKIDNNSVIRSHVVVGGESFSFARSATGDMENLKNFGRVIIDEQVEIMPFSHIAQGIWKDDVTHIGKNSKIDAHCYIGHGVRIGKSVLVAAGSVIGGNTIIGDRAWIGINATVSNRITVGNDSRISLGAVVTKNVPANTCVSGNFAIDHSRFIENIKKSIR